MHTKERDRRFAMPIENEMLAGRKPEERKGRTRLAWKPGVALQEVLGVDSWEKRKIIQNVSKTFF